MENIRVGCIPNSIDFKHPQDRRRYIPYFKERGIEFEVARFDRYYDILYVSLTADLNLWSSYKKRQKEKGFEPRIVFDLSDLYIVDNEISDFFRPLFHYLSGRTASLRFSYKKTVIEMLKNTDVLICGSVEQKQQLQEFHQNVVVVRDYFDDDIKRKKEDYRLYLPNEVNILWEGLSHGNIKIFKMIRDILAEINEIKINIHIITDSLYCKIGSSYLCQPTYGVIKSIFEKTNIKYHVYDWNEITFSSIATACDLAIIPIPSDIFMQNKPENKLLLLWMLGLPVITSDTKSYTRVMKAINEEYYCSNNEKWRKKIIELSSSQKAREKYMESADKYIKENCTAESIFKTYDYIFFNIK